MNGNSSKVVVVGALRRQLDDNRIGGQAFACRSLADGLSASGWTVIEVDSSIRSIFSQGGWQRAWSALIRLLKFVLVCLYRRPRAALIFCSFGLSFVEKGLMVMMARLFGVRAILLPRSGHLQRQLERSWAFRGYGKIVLRAADAVVCQSDAWRDYFRGSVYGAGRFHVVENWLPTESFARDDDAIASSGGGQFRVGYYSRIEESKGVFDFLRAVKVAHERRPGVHGVIFGDGTAIGDVIRWIEAEGATNYITYGGWLEQGGKSDALRKLDVLLFPSHAEGYPNALLEAVALKVPVISTRVGAVADMLEYGASARLVEVGDTEAMAMAIVDYVDGRADASAYAAAAFNRARRKNSCDVALRKIGDLLS